ncbi:MAG: sterol desaturase family protein [Bryobacteraceae bacterium]
MGLAAFVPGGPFVQSLAAVLLMDYGLYVWHVLTHKVPFLWRFHLVHHIDLDMDASTALRFHFGEMVLSVPWRLMQIVAVGASPLAVSIWQTLLFVSILFHHSNVQLPIKIERWLSFLIMTPRLHSTHHEANRNHSHSNWSSGLALWDLLHGTRLWTYGEDNSAVIGVPAYQHIKDVGLNECLTIPFLAQRSDWAPD